MITGLMANIASPARRKQPRGIPGSSNESGWQPMAGWPNGMTRSSASRSGRTRSERMFQCGIDVDDLDKMAEHLRVAGIDHDEPSPGGGQRILPITDPDGNQVVFFGE